MLASQVRRGLLNAIEMRPGPLSMPGKALEKCQEYEMIGIQQDESNESWAGTATAA